MMAFFVGLSFGLLLGLWVATRVNRARQRQDMEIGAILRANALKINAEAQAAARHHGIIIDEITFELTGRSLS